MFDFVFSAFSQVAKVFRTVQKSVQNARGAILIEFAICVPILILLLFGLHDIFKIARLQDQSNFVAHMIVQMIQNVSQNRPNKRITLVDLANVSRFAAYCIYPGTTMYSSMYPKYAYAHYPCVNFFCIKGEDDGKASCIWRATYYPIGSHTEERVQTAQVSQNAITYTVLKNNKVTNVEPSVIYPSLKISKGEIKIIVETYIRWFNSYQYLDKTTASTARQAFGTYFLTPQTSVSPAGHYFNSVAIFSPKRELFSETPPE